MGNTAYLTLITYFKNLFTIIVKKILKDKIRGLVVIKGLVSRWIREIL